MHISVADKHILDKILERKKKNGHRAENIDLSEMLREILTWANKFVPSESGSILLDDPTLNFNKQKSGFLYFVACFGKGSSHIISTTLPINIGIAGKTYLTGKPYISRRVKEDRNFFSDIDKKTNFVTKSIICAPIRIKGSTIGVIELINRHNGVDFSHYDLNLLRIFAEYTSTLIQNSLDAKRFADLSMRDNLTGLYNDRYFYNKLGKEVARAVRKGSDLSLIFLDLDRFKEVNDSHGHLAGSRVLAEVGAVIVDSLRIKNAAAVRYGGDEFTVILPNTPMESAVEYAEGLRKRIEDYIFLKHRYPGGEKALRIKGLITSSIGVASLKENISPGDLKDIREVRESLIRQADYAMYKSKQLGKNRVTRCPGALSPASSEKPSTITT